VKPSEVELKVKLAVPTEWPCWETMKLPDSAEAAGIKARKPKRERKASLRKGFRILS